MYVIENFFKDPDSVRENILNSQFIDWDQGVDKEVYKRVQILDLPEVSERLCKLHGDVLMLGVGARLNYEGELPNQLVHSDIGWGTHALVVYLHDQKDMVHGTVFYTHEETGLTKCDLLDVGDPGHQALLKDKDNLDAWLINSMVFGKYNRGVVYPSNLFHSRYPLESYGTSQDDGRLIVVAFFTPWEDL